jgi:hypothetical protein
LKIEVLKKHAVTNIMKFIVCLFPVLAIAPFSAGAQGTREFPMNTTYTRSRASTCRKWI